MRIFAPLVCLLLAGIAWANPVGVCPDGRIDINTADAAALQTLKGVGKKKAAAIVADRATNGAFKGVDGLSRVKGVGKKSVAKWAPQITTDCTSKAVAAVDNTEQVVKPAGAPVDINSATAEQLTAIKGIGKKTAAAIIALRAQKKGFKSVDELTEVKGLGKKTLDKIRGSITVKAQPTK